MVWFSREVSGKAALGTVWILFLWCMPFAHEGEELEPLRVMSWNVRNYNLTDRVAHGSYRLDYPKPEEEKRALRAVLGRERPDVLLLQEVGGLPFLRELAEDLLREYGLDYRYQGELLAEDEVRRLGVMSLRPLKLLEPAALEGRSFPYLDAVATAKRGVLVVEVQDAAGSSLTCITFHLKSRFTEDVRDPGGSERREKEARLIRDYLRALLQQDPQRRVLMMGDLNDAVNSQAYARITTVAGLTMMEEVPVQDGSGECWTFFYEKIRQYQQIDYVFVSPALLAEGAPSLRAWIVGGSDVLVASDHRPIMVELGR
jgi:endonuclease/exonuclease/phosphatase family metal-dependent hydrolase